MRATCGTGKGSSGMARNISEHDKTLTDEIAAIDALCDQILDRLPYETGDMARVYRAGQIMMASLIKHDILLRLRHTHTT